MIANGMCLRANLLNIERISRQNCDNLEKTVENVHILTHLKLFMHKFSINVIVCAHNMPRF